jgi:hypothetical protein
MSVLAVVALAGGGRQTWKPDIPKTWDDQAVATLEVPLAEPSASAKHVSADYYYRIRVRPIYKGYPVYAPGHEPPGYMDWLKEQEPAVLWDDGPHRPALESQADWIKAGEIVFDAPISFGEEEVGNSIADVRDPAMYQKIGVPVTKDGVMPFFVYVVRKKGEVELAAFGCATCHTRVTPQGSVLKGAQGNFPVDRVGSLGVRRDPVEVHRMAWRAEFGAPWVQPDPLAGLDQISAEEFPSQLDAIPPGVQARQGTSLTSPPQVPDLIGVKDRRYFDHTGLVQHRSIGDLMRYAAINQGMDSLASYGGFIPGVRDHKKLPDPTDPHLSGRYSDEQLYALALYVYSLQPPPNPNKFDALAARGQKVFERDGCTMCHRPPLYTDNKLTPADGFTPPKEHLKKYDILAISVGTDPDLALKTRRGTGYYKVPSLKGVWYRGMFGHSGWCVTLEDWFDPRRTRDDYVPTGFKPYGGKTFPVKGHIFGLDLSPQDRKALIAFLKTL